MTPVDRARDWVRFGAAWSRWLGAGAGLIGVIEVIVWIARPAWVPAGSPLYFMKVNAAAAVAILAAGVIAGAGEAPGWRRTLAAALGVIVLLITVPTLIEYLTSWSPGLDLIVAPDPTPDVGRMAAQTAGVLSLLAIALLAHTRDAGPASWACDVALLSAVLTLEVMVTGYFDHATLLYDVTARTNVATHSAVAQMLLCAALVFGRTGRGAFRVFALHDMGSAAMRTIVPAIIVLPVVLGRLSRLSEDYGWLGAAYAHTLFSVAQTAILGLTVYAFARNVNKLDERYRAERQRRQDAEKYVAVCAWTRRVRWQGRWVTVEEFLQRRFNLEVTHGISDEALAEQLASLDVRDVLDGAHEENV